MGKVTVQIKTADVKKAGDELDWPECKVYSKNVLAALNKANLGVTKVHVEKGGSDQILKFTVESKSELTGDQIKKALK